MNCRRCLAAGLIVGMLWGTLAVPAMTEAAGRKERLWRLADQQEAALDQRGIVLHEAALSVYMQAVAARLWNRMDSDLPSPRVLVIVDPRMDACAYPNGRCYVNTGILERVENEDQLAMVLAHELVHYARQHAVALYDSPGGGPPNGRRDERWTRQQITAAEEQADREGLAVLRRAGYRTAEVIPLLCNLWDGAKDDERGEALAAIADRRQRLQALIERLPSPPPRPAAGERRERRLHTILAPALLANAQAALRCGDWHRARRSVTAYLEARPDDARGYFIQGEILRRQIGGDPDGRCIGLYEAALERDPQYPAVHRALGELYFKAGQYRQARPYFETFLSLAPHDEAREYIQGYLRQCQN